MDGDNDWGSDGDGFPFSEGAGFGETEKDDNDEGDDDGSLETSQIATPNWPKTLRDTENGPTAFLHIITSAHHFGQRYHIPSEPGQ
jgi:hypothetical protein